MLGLAGAAAARSLRAGSSAQAAVSARAFAGHATGVTVPQRIALSGKGSRGIQSSASSVSCNQPTTLTLSTLLSASTLDPTVVTLTFWDHWNAEEFVVEKAFQQISGDLLLCWSPYFFVCRALQGLEMHGTTILCVRKDGKVVSAAAQSQ